MIKFTPKLSPVDHDGTLTGQMERLPFLITNTALEQIAAKLEGAYSGLSCNNHPEKFNAEVIFYIPGGNMMIENSVVYDLHNFCCEHFENNIRQKLYAEELPDNEE